MIAQRYADFGPELAREYLAREHGYAHSTETLRGWMIQAGLWQPKLRRAPRVHPARERRACRGELVQIDGSHHAWFEQRAAKCCLIAFIDDATGQVLAARFSATETTQAYFAVLQEQVLRHGAPLALYSDRHGIFTKHDPEDARPTQFERALLQLRIEPICAHSPQAKGRVERLFQTLQDRLVKALRLAGIDDMDAANAWLPAYVEQHNERFGVPAREPADAHRPWPGSGAELQRICCLHHQRQLSTQLSCSFEGHIVQLHADQPHAPSGRALIDIAQHANGEIELFYRGQPLAFSRYGVHERRPDKLVHAKQLNARVQPLADAEHKRLARLRAQIEHQDAQRANGIYTPAEVSNAPPRVAAGRYGLRPSQPAATHLA